MIDTPIYTVESFGRLIYFLELLKVVEVKFHRISMTMPLGLIGHGQQVPRDWIPLPIADTASNFAEIVPCRRNYGNKT